MKRPPAFLLGATLIFWGWQTDFLVFGCVMAMIAEPARYVKTRWDLSPADFKRISDVCALLFVGVTIFLFSSNKTNLAIVDLMKWLPMVLFPLVAVQFYSVAERIDISAISLISRRLEKIGKKPDITVDLSWPFFAICVISASAGNMRGVVYFAGILALFAWALFSVRSRRYSASLWLVVFCLAGGGGFMGQKGLHRLQLFLEEKTQNWFAGSGQDADPYVSRTAIGDVANLKPSNRIVFRAEPEPGTSLPLLLREACYVDFRYATWTARGYEFESGFRDTNGSWRIQLAEPKKGLTVFSYLPEGKGMLKLPGGVCRIDNLAAVKMAKNPLGAIKVEGPGMISPKIMFDPQISSDAPPTEKALAVPITEKEAVRKIVDKLGLSAESPKNAVKKANAR